MGIDSKHTCGQCAHYRDDEPCAGAGKPVYEDDLVGDCNMFKPKTDDQNVSNTSIDEIAAALIAILYQLERIADILSGKAQNDSLNTGGK